MNTAFSVNLKVNDDAQFVMTLKFDDPALRASVVYVPRDQALGLACAIFAAREEDHKRTMARLGKPVEAKGGGE